MRPKELFQLKWEHIDTYSKEILIPWNLNKSNFSRKIPIKYSLQKWLLRNLDYRLDYVINISYTSFRFWLIRISKKLNFKNLLCITIEDILFNTMPIKGCLYLS